MRKKESLHDLLVHDLGGPISIINSDLTNLLFKEERYGKLTEEQKKVLKRTLRNAKKAQYLLSEMVEALKSEEGRFDGSYFSVKDAIKEALIEVLDLQLPELAERLYLCQDDENFISELQNACIFVTIEGRYLNEDFFHDRTKVLQIMRNLFSNALKYRRKNVVINVFGDRDLYIQVEDDGPGITQEKKECIFKRFAHMGLKKDGNVEGLGFGLSCVKVILERARGDIQIHSEEEKGTKFIVRIPPLK
ncbi:MAG: sensor histidine kinase [Desulfobacterota bacterium]|nr:sensor histidine kinase [Thermodesulfobacteriota bacterium]MDW8001964.1 sensor histidine kinase [Deltaproteobacteria bacterium]